MAVPVGAHRRWLAIVGSAGQPRDGNPAAAYALFDPVRARLVFQRVPYDHRAAAARIRAAGLSRRWRRFWNTAPGEGGRAMHGAGGTDMAVKLASGAEIDGYRIGECVHDGGMASSTACRPRRTRASC